MQQLSTNIAQNITIAHSLFPLGTSFDLITRDLYFGTTRAYWIGINGFTNVDIMQRIFSDLQSDFFTADRKIEDLEQYMNSKIGFAQTSLSHDWDSITKQVLSGPSVLFIDGFEEAILLDLRQYPARGIGEPDTERVMKGAKDGFIETLLSNSNLIRRRIRSPELTFELLSVGTASKTDVAIAYLPSLCDSKLLAKLKEKINAISATSLTMGSKSLEELLVKKSWFHPLPSFQITERPDVACSYLMEGYFILLVDNSPNVIITPCNVFQFTQGPEDYYKPPLVGSYLRLLRFFCMLLTLLLLPSFLLLTLYFQPIAESLNLLPENQIGPVRLIVYVYVVEFLLDLFKYSATQSSSKFSGSLSIVGGLLVSEMAVQLNFASTEILFYAALTLLSSLALTSIEFAEGIRMYRMFLITTTAFLGFPGFTFGLILILCSALTTPCLFGAPYFWPLIPTHFRSLKALLLRFPTPSSQPSSSVSKEQMGKKNS